MLTKSKIHNFLKIKVQSNSLNQKCASNDECDKTKNLICKDGVCICKDANFYWNEKAASCGKI